MSEHIIINEVGPRDGLQSQDKHLDVDERRRLVEALLAAGLKHIEVGSFVSPKAVPQMAGTGELLAQLPTARGRHYSVLVPNMKGYELARAAGAQTVAVVVSATETMNQKNIRMSLEQTLAVARDIIERGSAEGATVQAYLSVAFECPFEGPVPQATIEEQTYRLLQQGSLLLDRRLWHRTLEGALEGHRQVGLHPRALAAAPLDDRPGHLEGLLQAHANVFLVHGLGGGDHHRHCLRARCPRQLGALHVRHQHTQFGPGGG